MELWIQWWKVVWQLRSTCSRLRTFLWFSTCLAGMTVRGDLLGVTSFVRSLGLIETCYDRILDFFHSKALNLEKLTRTWVALILKTHPSLLRINGKLVLVGDGLKVSKAGKKMPAVKRLHQQSDSNTKPEYIMGHSCQAIAILAGALQGIFAIPLVSRIHEGVIYSNRDKRTFLDKMVLLIDSLEMGEKFYYIADAYYASRKIIRGLLAQGNHLITRVRSNAVAYFPAEPPLKSKGPGRPPIYGEKIHLRDLFNDPVLMQTAQSQVLGVYAYHFWMKTMTPIRRTSGNQHLHRKSTSYRNAVRRKIDAYHRYIQTGLISQGLLMYLSSVFPKLVWAHFGSWIRTIRPGICPSELVTAIAMRNTLTEFLADSNKTSILTKFIRERIDISRTEGLRMIA